jgi:hypothetical protein
MSEPAMTTCLGCLATRPLTSDAIGGVIQPPAPRPALAWRPCPACDGWQEHEDSGHPGLDVLREDVRELVELFVTWGVHVALGPLAAFEPRQVAFLMCNLSDGQLLVWLNSASDPQDQLAALPEAWRDLSSEPATWCQAVDEPAGLPVAYRICTVR